MATNTQEFRSRGGGGTATGFPPVSGIRDNHSRGSVGQFLHEKIRDGSAFVVSAYFTIYAYDALRAELERIEGMRFLFGEPRFIGSIDPDRTDKKAFKIEDEGLFPVAEPLSVFASRRLADNVLEGRNGSRNR